MRGRNVSKPIDVLVQEAKNLAAQGVKELVIVAEDTTAYGLDLGKFRHGSGQALLREESEAPG